LFILPMSAFASLILFICIAIGSMCLVAYSNYKVGKAKGIRNQLQKYKSRVEELEDVVLALDQLCENRIIVKLVNDDVIEFYEKMIALDPSAGYLSAGKANAFARLEELSDIHAKRHINRLCNSDAQIARLQAYLNEACRIVRMQHNRGKISSMELQEYTLELEWLHLQVGVISNIAQGHKAYTRQDVLTANAFYKKAQTELMRSGHPDKRRHKMIKQMADILFGRRKSLDKELMPEDEFNPDNNQPKLPAEDPQLADEALDLNDSEELSDIHTAMIMDNEKNHSDKMHKNH
ncbi:MAG: hypothetical protein AAFZ92_07300, partial [Pseudomonadota bacterium]